MITQIEKKMFKTMNPTCHDFNSCHASKDSIPLLVGFNNGIITLHDIIRKDIYKVFNEEVKKFINLLRGSNHWKMLFFFAYCIN